MRQWILGTLAGAVLLICACASTRTTEMDAGFEQGVSLLSQARAPWPADTLEGIHAWGTARGDEGDADVQTRAEHGALLRLLSTFRVQYPLLSQSVFLRCIEQHSDMIAVADSIDPTGIFLFGVYLSDSLVVLLNDCLKQ